MGRQENIGPKVLIDAETLTMINARRKEGISSIEEPENIWVQSVRESFLKSVKCDIPIYHMNEIKNQHLEIKEEER